MFIKNFSKLFFYANQNHNRLFYFSTNFLQNENKIFHSNKPNFKKTRESYYLNYLMNNMDCYSSVYDIESLSVINDSDPEAIKLLLGFGCNNDFPEKEYCFNEVLKYAQHELSNYGVDEICKIIVVASKNKFLTQYKQEMYKIKCCIDEELTKRYFSVRERLKILFTLSSVYIGHFKPSLYFQYKTVMKFLEKIDSLSLQEIVQIFYCVPARNFSKVEGKFFVLSYLNNIISLFNSDELGIIAEGLVNGNMTFNNENIYGSILKKTRNEIENIHPVPFFSVCMVLKKFLKASDGNNFRDFQEELIPYLSKLDNTNLLSLAYAGYRYKILNLSFKETLVKTWKESIMDFNYSEIARLIQITVTFNIQDEELLFLAKKNLERVLDKYHNLFSVLKNLSFHRLYPEKLLDEVFSDIIFNKVCSKDFGIKEKAEWWSLYCNVKLEKPECINETFSTKSLNKIYKKSKIAESLHSSIKSNRFYSHLRNIEKILGEVYGESKVFVVDVLPHFSSGIVMRFNTNLQAQEISENFRSSEAHCFKKSLKDDHLWIFIMLLQEHNFLWDTDTLDLPNKTQCRQLKSLGYEILMVKLPMFLCALKQKSEKAHIENLMDVGLKNISNEIKTV